MRRRFGAAYAPGATRFVVWADDDRQVELMLDGELYALRPGAGGLREVSVPGIQPGARYGYRINGDGPFPDPASRSQPDGPHGLSAVVDSSAHVWRHDTFRTPPLREAVLYEMHIGAFTAEGTYRAARERLPHLRDLGVNVLEIMPLAECPGRWNWGYDGVGLYAPYHVYGPPGDLRAFVDEAHGMELAVLLDVVYNHLGPDGAYHGLYSSRYRSSRRQTPWGDGMNFDGDGSANMRAFFIESALHWLEEYHVDGFRLDAVHAIADDSAPHFLEELTAAVHAARPGALVMAEDNRNEARLVRPRGQGYGLDAVWADDFHHHVRRRLAGDRHGYFAAYSGELDAIARTLRDGWFYCGQPTPAGGKPRGASSEGIPRERMVICLQNHDQTGNRALGERLHHQIHPEQWLAASAVLLLAPETPLLFMGQEWAAGSPFLYFTDHHGELGRAVSEGRRQEFAAFPAFSRPDANALIPDPQAGETFFRSKLNWEEVDANGHRECLSWYRELLAFRKTRTTPPQVRTRLDRVLDLQWVDGRRLLAVLDREAVSLSVGGFKCALAAGRVQYSDGRVRWEGAGAILLEPEAG